MKLGRNDPCHCGSGKKYKKCCLERDEALAREQADRPRLRMDDDESAWVEEVVGEGGYKYEDEYVDAEEEEDESTAALDEQTAARNARWKEFEAAHHEGKMALFLQTLEQAELMDDDVAFEMLDKIRMKCLERGDRDRYDELIVKLRERLPEVYAESAPYYLQNMIADAVTTQRWENVRTLANELAGIAAEDIDIFDSVVAQLAYHGQLAILVEIVSRAWPKIRRARDIEPWGIDELADKATNFVVFDYLERFPSAHFGDPELLQRLSFFARVHHRRYAEFFNFISGRATRSWTMQDFHSEAPVQPSQEKRDKSRRYRFTPGEQNLIHLSFEFLHYLHHEEHVSFPKAEMARDNIVAYIIARQGDELEERKSLLESVKRGNRSKPKTKRTRPEHLLCPDAVTLERYFADMLVFFNSLYYEVAATFELLPAWLRFLEARRLIDRDVNRRALVDLSALHEDLLTFFQHFQDDPMPAQAIQRWSEGALA